MAKWSLDRMLDEAVEGSADPDLLAAVSDLRRAIAAGDIEWAVSEAMAVQFFSDRPLYEAGRKSKEGGLRGGRPAGGTLERDMDMAREFLRRRPKATCTDTALKISVGAGFGLGRSQAIEAINGGLKKVSG
jgi:hypothetical protein